MVDDLFGQEGPLEKLASDGLLTSPCQCAPELRPSCFDAVLSAANGEDEQTVIYEWGEWDGLGEEHLSQLVAVLLDEAAARGFNLLTDSKLAAAVSR